SFEAGDEPAVQTPLQRFPAVRDVDAAEGVACALEFAGRVARADFDVRVFGDVAEGLEVAVVEQVVVRRAFEDVSNVTAEDLAGGLDEGVPRVVDALADRDSLVCQPFITEEIVNDERLVGPRADVRVPGVVLAE